MANYIASARSNYFKVKNIEEFKEGLPTNILVNVTDHENKTVCMYIDSCNGDGWPDAIYNEITDEYTEWDIVDYVSQHLVDDQWCVIQEVGAEHLIRYLVGYSKAFNNKKDLIVVNIDDIYDQLIGKGTATLCQY